MWLELPYQEWKDTLDTLHMWMQIVGKVKLQLSPFVNQWWEVAFYVTVYGMTTGRIPSGNDAFQVDFDFLTHTLSIRTSNNQQKILSLESRSVAEFYKEFMEVLMSLGIHVVINPVPVEVQDVIPFTKDTRHASYAKDYVTEWWRILLQISMVFDRFRSSFRGKSSPIHFFWGSFDLSGTRFSGKTAVPPKMEGSMGKIMRFAENEENFAFGFWPGDQRLPYPAFYSYMYPTPKGMQAIKFDKSISFNEQLGECILPYEVIRKATSPEKSILRFLETTYTESAKLAGWDITSLQGKVPSVG
jgi:hypothetical protein